MSDQSRNPLDGFDVEGAINKHYDQINDQGGPFSGSVSVPQPAPLVQPEPVASSSFIMGGHEDHDHDPIVINSPCIVLQYGTNAETGEPAFSLNVVGIEGGILGAINELRSVADHLEGEVSAGNIPLN